MRLEYGYLVIFEDNTVGSICHGGYHRPGIQMLGKLYLGTERHLQPVGIDINRLEGIPYLRRGNGHMVGLDGQGILGGRRTDSTAVLARSYGRTVLIPLGGAAFNTGCQRSRITDR